MENLKRVLWAVDAFGDNSQIQKRTAAVLRELQGKGVEIEPVFVMSPAQLNLSIDFDTPWIQQYRPAAKQAIEHLISDLELKGIQSPKILVQNLASTGEAVRFLENYAVSSGADLIVTGSHGRSGVQRFVLGSFAETLLLYARVPVMIVGHSFKGMGKKAGAFKRVFFPTDFKKNSEKVFRRVVAMAKEFDSKVILFHSIPSPVEPVFQSGVYLLGGAWIPVYSYFAYETERKTRHAEAWARWAQNRGVQVHVVIYTRGGNVADQIVNSAKNMKAGLIFMDAESGAISTELIGSITRQVVRKAECPVWVFRSARFAEAAAPRSEEVPLPKKRAA